MAISGMVQFPKGWEIHLVPYIYLKIQLTTKMTS